MDEAVNAFKHSLADSASDLKRAIATITQSTTGAIKNIEKTTIEQGKKNQSGYQKKYSNSDRELSAINLNPITDPIRAEAQAKKHAPLFAGKGDYKGLDVEQTAVKLKEDILGIGEGKPTRKFGHSKMLRTSQEESDINYNDASYRTRSRGYRLIGKEATEAVMAKISTTKTDAEGNIHFQEDFKAASLVFDNIEYAQRQKKEERIEADKAEAKAYRDRIEADKAEAKAERLKEKEERKRENLLKEFRAEFKDTEKEIQNEERQQVLALKERQQLQLGVGNDLIQGGAGMAMGVALNKPTIIFASLATSAAKVTSRFGMLGKAIAGVIAVLSAVGAVVNVLSGKTSDNVLKGSVKDIRPEYSGALKAVGASFLGDENALLEDAGNITNLKANISNEVGFSQTLSSIISSPLGATLAKKGINPLNILQKVNGMTTEDAHDYLMGIMESFGNSNERRLFAKTFGLENSLNLQHQRMLNGSGETGRDIIREAKNRIGEIPNEVKHAIDESQKEETLARSALGNNPKSTKFIAGAIEGVAKFINRLNGDNNEKDKIARAEYDAGRLLGRSLPYLINEGEMPKEIDYEHIKSLKIGGFTKADKKAREAHRGFLERDRTFNGLSGKDLEKAQAQNLQQFFNEAQTIQMNSKNTNSGRNNGLNVTSNVTLTNKSSVPLKISDTNTNAVIVQPEGAR